MTHFLVSDDNPEGYRLEDILHMVQKDILFRCTKIVDDQTPEARRVLHNNTKILELLSQAVDLAQDSTTVLKKSFGPPKKGKPRIGKK